MIDPDLEDERYWWGTHRDQLLPRRAAACGPADEVVLCEVVPSLWAAAREPDERLAAASAIALAKIARHLNVPGFGERVLGPLLARRDLARLAAVYALGISAEGAPAIERLRALACARDVPVEVGAAAITSLGLICAALPDGTAQSAVLRALRESRPRAPADDERAAPFVRALGALRPATDAERRFVRDLPLDAVARDRGEKSDCFVAHALAVAAGNADPRSADAEFLRARCRAWLADPACGKEAPQRCRAAVLALGDLALPHDASDADDELLERTWRTHGDCMTRCFALVALGRRGGAANLVALCAAMRQGSKAIDRPWVAMALMEAALHGGAPPPPGEPMDASADVEDALRLGLDTKNPFAQATVAVAIGECRCVRFIGEVHRLLEKNRCLDYAAGRFALALALLQGPAAGPELRARIAAVERPENLPRELALAFALAEPAAAGEVLVPLLAFVAGTPTKTDLTEDAGEIAAALGWSRDPAAVWPLLELLDDRSQPPAVRTAAAVALGCLCDLEPRPWNAELAATGDYRAATRSLLDPETGVLSWW
jgi:hypothetical protein